jgi:uncharacterized protein (TIGR03435 family)
MIPTPLSVLANHLWQSTLFAGLMMLLSLAVRKNRASTRHWLWVAASVKFLIPFSWLIALGSQLQWQNRPAAAKATASVLLHETAQPFAVPITPQLLALAPEAPSRIAEVLLLLWLCGFVAVVYYWVAAWLHIRAAVRRSRPLDIDLPSPCNSLDVRATEAVLEPCVFGLLHPVLVVPATMKARLSADEWNAVLLHEASHIQRRDNLTGAVHMIVETMFWFYPPVWWIGKRLIHEREQACDEAVVGLMGNPEAYASGILNVCRLYMESRLASSPGVGGSNLRKRIEGIMANHKIEELNKPKRLLFLAAGVMAVVLPISAGVVGPVSRIGFQSDVPKAFEVASIKLNQSNQRGSVNPSSGRLVITAMTVKSVIQWAYGVQFFELINVDSPVLNERVDIEAKTERPVGSVMEIKQMLQPLLADRFKLAVHREMREMNALALVLARNDGKLGPKMKKTQSQCDGLGTANTSSIVARPSATGDRPKPNDVPRCGFAPSGVGRIVGTGLDMAGIVGLLAPSQRISIVDQTGLDGRYDIDVTYTPEPFSAASLAQRGGTPPPGVNVDPNGPNLFTALEQQLGLKLQPKKLPVPVLIIDHIEPLIGN